MLKSLFKILVVILVIIVIVLVGGYFVVKSNSGPILEKLSQQIEKSTGYPLHLEDMPKIGLFPPSVVLGKAHWGDENGEIFVSLDKANIKVSASSIFSGSAEISSVDIDGLFVQFRQNAGRASARAAQGSAPAAPPVQARSVAPPQTSGVPVSVAQGTGTAPGSVKGLDKVRDKLPASITIRNASLRFLGSRGEVVDITGLNTEIVSRNGIATASPLSFGLMGSTVNGSARADLGTAEEGRLVVDAEVNAPAVNLEQLARTLLQQDIVAGFGNLEGKVRFDPLNAVPSLTGSGHITSSGLELKTSVLPPDLAKIQGVAEQGRIDSVVIPWEAGQGKVRVSGADIKSARYHIQAAGLVDLLAETLDFDGTIDIPGLATLPVSLKGPLKSPKYAVNQQNAVDAVVRTLESHGVDVDKAINDGLNRLFRR